MFPKRSLNQIILDHFRDHHRRGGGCRAGRFVKEMDFPHYLISRVLNGMRSLFRQGKLVRICRGKYRLPRPGETPAIAWAESASIVGRPRVWQVGLKPQEE